MRRARVLAVALLLAACGDPPAKPAPPPRAAAPAPEAPLEARLDDDELAMRVVVAARGGRPADVAALELPPRCDRARVAVSLLHDQLLGVNDPPPLAALLDALDALAKASGGASPKSLGPLVAAWRAWTPAQVADEAELARRLRGAVAALGAAKPSASAVSGALAGAPSAPPKSPGAAGLAMARAAALVLATPGHESVPQEIADALEVPRRAYIDLGWPGGFARIAEELARRLLREDARSFRGAVLADMARAEYGRSQDEVRAALVFAMEAEAAERQGDMRRAERLASAARDRLLPTNARGRERFDVLRRHGEAAYGFGRLKDAALDLRRAWDEGAWAQLDVTVRVDVAAMLAATLFRRGGFAETIELCREAATLHDDAVSAGAPRIEPARSELDVIAGQAAMELADPATAARLFASAAADLETFAASDPKRRPDADQAHVLLAGALFKKGDAAGARRALDVVLSRADASPGARRDASQALREAGLLDDAERELTRAEKEGGPAFAATTQRHRALLRDARGDVEGARESFAAAVAHLTRGDPEARVGWGVARPQLEWARLELRLGRVFEADKLAGDAIGQLRDVPGFDMELDRAKKLYVDLERRMLHFDVAEKATTQRLADGPPGDAARREEALLDLLVLRLELLFQRAKDADAKAAEAAAMFPEGWKRTLAVRAVEAARAGLATADADAPADASPRWKLLRDVVALKVNDFDGVRALCKRCGESEAELRRWAAAKFRHGAHPWALELRRRADAADMDEITHGFDADETGVILEPFGDHLELCVIGRGNASASHVEGDGGLGDLVVKTYLGGRPDEVAEAAKRVAGLLQFAEVKRLIVSLPATWGPLPLDLVPSGDGTLLDRCEVIQVESVTEYLRAKKRTAPGVLAILPDAHATLETRHALVQIGDVDPRWRARFLELVAERRKAGRDASAAVREAKLALRAEWTPDPKRPYAVPAWAAFVLRGAP